MPDPIHAVNPTQPLDVTSAGQTPPQGGAAAQSAPGAVDSADIARAEVLLATISAATGSVPAIDQSRVVELQSAILSGSYQIDPKQIARKLAEIEQLLTPEGL